MVIFLYRNQTDARSGILTQGFAENRAGFRHPDAPASPVSRTLPAE